MGRRVFIYYRSIKVYFYIKNYIEVFITLMYSLDHWLKFKTAHLGISWLERTLVFFKKLGVEQTVVRRSSLWLLTLVHLSMYRTKRMGFQCRNVEMFNAEVDSLTASMLLLMYNYMEVFCLGWRYSIGFHTTIEQ